MSRAAIALLVLAAPALALAVEPAAPTTVGVVVDSTDAPPLGARVRSAIHGVLDRDARLTVRSMDLGAVAEAGPLAVADGALKAAEKLFRDADLDPAKASLEQAQKLFEENLIELVRRDGSPRLLRDSYILAAKVRFFGGDFEGSKDALRHVFAIDPKQTFTAFAFPPQMKRVVVEARLLFDTLGFSKLEISSEPAGAVIYINGTKMPNPSPASFEVACGPNLVELRVPGHASARSVVDVGGVGDTGKLAVQLKHGDDPESRAREATSLLGDGASPKVQLEPVVTSLQVEFLMLIHIAATSDSRFRLSGEVYRPARGGRHASPASHEQRLERSGATSTIEGEAEALARALAEQVHADRPLVAKNDAPEGESALKRFRRSKAFWYVIGGAAGAVVLGVSLGVGIGVGVSEHRKQIANEVVLLGGR